MRKPKSWTARDSHQRCPPRLKFRIVREESVTSGPFNFGEFDSLRRRLNIGRRICVLNDQNLTIVLQSREVSVEMGVQVCTTQIVGVAFWLAVGQQRGVKNDETSDAEFQTACNIEGGSQ